MSRIVLALTSCILTLFSAGCGEEEIGLNGSQCMIVSCKFDKIVCQLYPDPNKAIIIQYLRIMEAGQEWTAKIVIQLDGVEQVEGRKFEGDDFLDRVLLQRPGSLEQWPEFTGNFCEISKGGDRPDQEMSGKCAFKFVTGYFLTAKFSCSLEAV